VNDPLDTILRPGPAAPAETVARSLARSTAPAEADVHPPAWLWPDQGASLRRSVAALQRHGGALLADPVGSGKTWVALAAAHAVAGSRGVAVLVPAALRTQWLEACARTGVVATILSHQVASRGRLPGFRPELVIIDESHHFRNPETQRYVAVSRWLIGARVLLLSATPIVNRLTDLAHQLRLAVRDDCLSARGCPSLWRALAAERVPAALGDLLLCRPPPSELPRPRSRTILEPLSPVALKLLDSVGRLALSREPGIEALLRGLLLRALASSPGAFLGALRRYRALLHHARLAAQAGRPVSRAAIRAFAGPGQEQLVLWELLETDARPTDLVLDDAAAVDALIATAAPWSQSDDARARRLREILDRETPTIVFTAYRDSLAWLRRRLEDQQPAWLTGSRAGMGRSVMPREVVLAWFAPGGGRPGAARVLLATDVAAEGLNLQHAGRIVHYDLPWTSVRVDQRNGRALRLGSARRDIEIVEFPPAPDIEARLGILERLRSKRRLVGQAGLGEEGRWLYRWRSELAAWAGAGTERSGFTVVQGGEGGWLVGIALDAVDEGQRIQHRPASLVWFGDDGTVDESPQRVVRLLKTLAGRAWRAPTAAERDALLDRIRPFMRSRLIEAAGAWWHPARLSLEQRKLARRVRRLAVKAAERRDPSALDRLDRLRAWLGGGLTAGEQERVAEAAAGVRDALESLLALASRSPRRQETTAVRITGVAKVTTFRG
jgi:hypothetical protein